MRGPFDQITYAADISDRAQREVQTRVDQVQAESARQMRAAN
jgi:hypothetical protein